MSELKNGAVMAYQHHNRRMATLVELRCETDFLANSQEFRAACAEIAMHVGAMGYPGYRTKGATFASPLGENDEDIRLWDQQLVTREEPTTVSELITALRKSSREKIEIGRIVKIAIE